MERTNVAEIQSSHLTLISPSGCGYYPKAKEIGNVYMQISRYLTSIDVSITFSELSSNLSIPSVVQKIQNRDTINCRLKVHFSKEMFR